MNRKIRTAAAAVLAAGFAFSLATEARAGQHVRENVTLGALTRRAQVMVRGQVTIVRTRNNVQVAFVQVSSWLKGDRPATTIAVASLAGTDVTPGFSPGDQVLLFLGDADQVLIAEAQRLASGSVEGVAAARAFTLEGDQAGIVRLDQGAGGAADQIVAAHLAFGNDPVRLRNILVQALTSADRRIANDAAADLLFLAELGSPPSGAEATTCADVLRLDRDKIVDKGALVELLGRAGGSDALNAVLNFSIAPDARRHATECGEALRRLGAQAAVNALVDYIPRASSDAARARAVRVLGLVAGEASVNALGQLATSSGQQTRLAAVLALGETGSAQAVPALQTALGGNDETTARAAAVALVGTGRAGVDVLKSFLAASGPSSRGRFVDALMRDPIVVSSSFRSQVGQ